MLYIKCHRKVHLLHRPQAQQGILVDTTCLLYCINSIGANKYQDPCCLGTCLQQRMPVLVLLLPELQLLQLLLCLLLCRLSLLGVLLRSMQLLLEHLHIPAAAAACVRERAPRP